MITMITPDLLNSLFECAGCLFVFAHIRAVMRDKHVSGVSIPAVGYFLAWGLWNLFYYPHLGQSLSYYGALLLVIANSFYIALLIYYRHFQPNRRFPVSRLGGSYAVKSRK